MTVASVPGTEADETQLVGKLKTLCEPTSIHDNLVKGGEGGLTDATLRRWLAARKWDVDIAFRDLSKHADWRAEYVPNGKIPEEDVAAELNQKKAFMQGTDSEGHSITVVLVHNHVGLGLESSKRYIAYCLDAAVRLAESKGQTKVIGILDVEEMGIRNSDFGCLRAIFDLLQNHYVERLHKLYMYCAPTIFWALWKMVSPFVDPVTKSKVEFIEKKDGQEVFAKLMAPDFLPARYKGTAELIPFDQAWKTILQQENQTPVTQ